MFWFDRENERKFEISAEELVGNGEGASRRPQRASWEFEISFPEKK